MKGNSAVHFEYETVRDARCAPTCIRPLQRMMIPNTLSNVLARRLLKNAAAFDLFVGYANLNRAGLLRRRARAARSLSMRQTAATRTLQHRTVPVQRTRDT